MMGTLENFSYNCLDFRHGSKIIQYQKFDGGDQTQETIPNFIILKS